MQENFEYYDLKQHNRYYVSGLIQVFGIVSEVNNSLSVLEEIHSSSVGKSKQQLSICVLSVPSRSAICFIFTNCNQLNQCVAFPTYLKLLVKGLSAHIVL